MKSLKEQAADLTKLNEAYNAAVIAKNELDDNFVESVEYYDTVLAAADEVKATKKAVVKAMRNLAALLGFAVNEKKEINANVYALTSRVEQITKWLEESVAFSQNLSIAK